MIGAARYFAPRMFAPRYWPKVGDTILFQSAWAVFANGVVGIDGSRS